MPPVSLVLAFFLDLLIGDPPRFPHPVKLIGRAVVWLERLLYSPGASRARNMISGAFLAAVVTALSFAATHYAIKFSYQYLGGWAGLAVTILIAYTAISVKSLADAAREVFSPLAEGDLPRARKTLSMIVGRDTGDLDEAGIARGAVETVAENASDGIVAPLFYLAIGGPPLAMAYKAVNTMDSMIGYRSDRYIYFGRAAARLDDIANFIPARLTALLMVAASYLLSRGGKPFSWKGSWRVLGRDGSNHASPNSGHPEAAAAGALGVRLGGEIGYFGVRSVKPFIGDPDEPLSAGKIRDAVNLMYVTAFLALAVSVVISYLLQ